MIRAGGSKRGRTIVLICALMIMPAMHLSPGEVRLLGREFFAELLGTPPIKRDFYLDARLNLVIEGRGKVISIDTGGRYKRAYRLTLSSLNTPAIAITYLVFTDKEEYLKMLRREDVFEFKGQFVIYTPLNSPRDAYIFDVILEDGAIVVE